MLIVCININKLYEIGYNIYYMNLLSVFTIYETMNDIFHSNQNS